MENGMKSFKTLKFLNLLLLERPLKFHFNLFKYFLKFTKIHFSKLNLLRRVYISQSGFRIAFNHFYTTSLISWSFHPINLSQLLKL